MEFLFCEICKLAHNVDPCHHGSSCVHAFLCKQRVRQTVRTQVTEILHHSHDAQTWRHVSGMDHMSLERTGRACIQVQNKMMKAHSTL